MSRRADKPAHHALSYLPQVAADLDALDRLDPELAAAALATLDDLAHGRQRGKVLGTRNITGDLTGLARLRFDLPGVRPLRFRVVYRLMENDAVAEIVAIGERGGHAFYREALARLADAES